MNEKKSEKKHNGPKVQIIRDEPAAAAATASAPKRDHVYDDLVRQFKGARVRERLGDDAVGTVSGVGFDHLIAVQWDGSSRMTLHVDDELEVVEEPANRPVRKFAPTMGDAFSSVRGYLPKFEDEPRFDEGDPRA